MFIYLDLTILNLFYLIPIALRNFIIYFIAYKIVLIKSVEIGFHVSQTRL